MCPSFKIILYCNIADFSNFTDGLQILFGLISYFHIWILHFYHCRFILFFKDLCPPCRLIFLALCLYVPASQTTAIVVYTSWEKHALVGTDVRLSCSFFSWQWTSPDVTFSWHYRADGAKEGISVRRNMHTHARRNSLF